MVRRRGERWYVVHTYSGYENKVKNNLEHRIKSMHMEDKIFEVVVPVEDVLEYKSGKKQLIQKKLLPGYLLVRMKLDDDSWYVVQEHARSHRVSWARRRGRHRSRPTRSTGFSLARRRRSPSSRRSSRRVKA